MASSVSHADYENELSLDFQGNHADKSKTGGWLAAGLILELLTQIAIYLGRLTFSNWSTIIKLKLYQASSVSHADYENEASLDFQGNHADKSKTGGWLAAGLILGTLRRSLK
ncbi:NRT1/ PTR family 6.4-like protein [Tanacetum coccineum]